MTVKGKKPGFRDYLTSLKQISSNRQVSSHSIFAIYGKSPWLAQEAVRTLRETARKGGLAVCSIEGKDVSETLQNQIFSQSSLFEEATLYIVTKAESAKSLIGKLPGAEFANKLALVFGGEKVPTGFAEQANVLAVPCYMPWPNEMAKAVEALAEIEGLKLDHGAIQALLETLGNDLQKMKNELQRIALQFRSPTSVLKRDEIAPFLGALKEEDVYQLDRYLLDRKWAQADSLIFNLLDRGEKPLSILAMLSNHCRNVLNVCDGISKGMTPTEIGARSKLPQFILKNYLTSGRSASMTAYSAALSACQQADRSLKSSPVADSLVLGKIISSLSAADIRN